MAPSLLCGGKRRASAACTPGLALTADQYALAGAGALAWPPTRDVASRDHLDPQRTVGLVVRRAPGLAQCIQAGQFSAGGSRGEAGQFKQRPGTGVQFLHVDVQTIPFSADLVLAASTHVGFHLVGELLAVATQHNRYSG